MATTTHTESLAVAQGVLQLVAPLLAANIIDWILFIILSAQFYVLLRRHTRRTQHKGLRPLALQDAASAHAVDLRFAPASLPVDQARYAHGTDTRVSLASLDPYSYPLSPATPSSAQQSQVGHFAFTGYPRARTSVASTQPQAHPRVPHEPTLLTFLVCILYALVCLQVVLGTIYAWGDINSKWDIGGSHLLAGQAWMQIVATDVIGAVVFALSIPFLAYRIFLLSPRPLPSSRPHSILKSKSQHIQLLPLPRHRFRYMCSVDVLYYTLPVFLSLASLGTCLCGLISGGKHINNPKHAAAFDAITCVWLAGSLVINAFVFGALLFLLVRAHPSNASRPLKRIAWLICETGFAQFLVAVIALALFVVNKHDTRMTASAAPALLLPALYANTVLLTLTRAPARFPVFGAAMKPRSSGPDDKQVRDTDARGLKTLSGYRARTPAGKSVGTFGENRPDSGSVWSDGSARGEKGRGVSFGSIELQPMHMERDSIGEGSNMKVGAAAEQYGVHVLGGVGGRSRPMGPRVDTKGKKKSQRWLSNDTPVMSIGRVKEGDEENEHEMGSYLQKQEEALYAPGWSESSISDMSELEQRTRRHSSRWGRFSGPARQGLEAGFGRTTPQTQLSKSNLHRRDSHSSYTSTTQPPDDTRGTAVQRVRMSRTEPVRMHMEPRAPTVGDMSAGGENACDDTSIMIISPVNNEPSIVEPSMFKAASVAATRASTGSAWSSYTYPKPMAFPELDEDLQHGVYDLEPVTDAGPEGQHEVEPAHERGASGDSKGAGDVHPYARAAQEEVKKREEDDRVREQQSRMRRWQVHPLTRMVEMGRLKL